MVVAATAVPCIACGVAISGSASGYCGPCETTRPAARARLRTRYWRRLSAAYRRMHPICQWPGCYRASEIVDHKTPRDQGGTDAWDNLQALCRKDHAIKTRGDVSR